MLPDSVKATMALRFRFAAASTHAWAVAEANRYHEEIGRYAAEKSITRLFSVGHDSQFAAAVFGEGAQHFENKKDLITALTEELSGATVLVKGSRSAQMETVVKAICHEESCEPEESN